jgi:hypothetical protein
MTDAMLEAIMDISRDEPEEPPYFPLDDLQEAPERRSNQNRIANGLIRGMFSPSKMPTRTARRLNILQIRSSPLAVL